MNKRIRTVLAVWLAAVALPGCLHFAPGRSVEAQNLKTTLAPTVSERGQIKPAFVPGRLLVKYRAGASTATRGMMRARGAVETRRLAGVGVHVVDLPVDADVEDFAEQLRRQPDVEFAEPDYLVYPVNAMIPDDPLYSSQWHLPVIGCPEAWAITRGSDQVVIAICDTGVDPTHPDLAPKLVPGWNVVDNNSNTSPVAPHGTWTAGTAAAAGNNAIGVASPALNCLIMPIRVTSRSDGAALISDLAAGVIWAADHGARVASVSYMGGASGLMSEAGQYIQSRGGVLVMASGNTGTYTTAPDSPSIIVVGATDQGDQVPHFSTTGSYVDLGAPGFEILTTSPNGTYQTVSGTSFSAPLVAGAAALVLSVNPSLSPAQVDTILKVSADDLGSEGWDPGYGWGRLNVGIAVGIAEGMLNGTSDTTSPALGFLQPQIGGDLNGLIGISGGELVRVSALDDTGVAQVSLFADGVFVSADGDAPYTFLYDTSSFADGSQHTLTAVAMDQAGNSTSISTVVTTRAGFDATPPTLAFVQPQVIGGSATVVSSNATPVQVDARDNAAVASVSVFADGVLLGTLTAAPYTFVWDTSSFAAGSQHTLVAVAADQANNFSSVEITVTVTASSDTTPPAVSFQQPQAGGEVGRSPSEPITVNATDNVGVASVSLYADGNLVGAMATAPYAFAWDTSALAVGSQHTLTAAAADQAGNSSTVSITVTVRGSSDTAAPRVSFVSPTDGEHVKQNVKVNVNATDNVAVTRVELYAENRLVASWSRAPYTVKWKTNKLPKGAHTLISEAYDAAGNRASASITVYTK